MTKKEILIKIDGCIETDLTHDKWLDQFILWLESRGEYFGGTKDVTNKSVSRFLKTIRETVEKYKYDSADDPVLIEHKKKIQKIKERLY